jgi:hypothetical protein
VIGDSLGTTIVFTIDGKIGSPTPGAMFLGVTHRDQPGGRQLRRGEEQERQLVSYLEQWLDGNFDRKELETIFKTADSSLWTKEQFYAYHVKQVVEARGRVPQSK